MSEDAGNLAEVLRQIAELRRLLGAIQSTGNSGVLVRKFVEQAGELVAELQKARETLSPARLGVISITLGRSDSIAKFFAFSFVNQEKRELKELFDAPFFGSGVYAVYYHGSSETAYLPLSGTETPIYVGKADPESRHAETAEAQGQAVFRRLKEHAKNIKKTTLNLDDFRFRYAAIQTGMQAAVEEFMIHLFRPIWNKEMKICFGIGKHGDNATTRANKRSPWDTMHPGREWAVDTIDDQMKRCEIEARITAHFAAHPVIPDRDALYKLLALS